ncbi:C-C motif chemokine 20-like [Cheilinus undulatus]|uniref:C-C motif chemokine 20-like n=1 Tax=Cheilinus undulatus TaxID=241271 RepID=UPI001BD25A7B|nr:C-C motif chemokine 20-like [Cheilinus undulatus]
MVSTGATVMVIMLITVCVQATSADNRMCCRSYTKTKIPFAAIKGYSIQTTPACPINAIIFHTKKGKHLCVNLASGWLMNYINRLRTKARAAHIKTSV